jgi:hypothetical protein
MLQLQLLQSFKPTTFHVTHNCAVHGAYAAVCVQGSDKLLQDCHFKPPSSHTTAWLPTSLQWWLEAVPADHQDKPTMCR